MFMVGLHELQNGHSFLTGSTKTLSGTDIATSYRARMLRFYWLSACILRTTYRNPTDSDHKSIPNDLNVQESAVGTLRVSNHALRGR